jgi:EmrB/QacA subfamily drug resistance transporter
LTERRRKRLTLVATILGSTIVFLDATVVQVALPALSRDLDAGLADQQWVVEVYLLALVALLLIGGSLGDQFGRRRMFIAGLIGFGATSILCAIAPSTELLIAARALQGLAGALLVPGSLAILASTFEGAERGKAVGTWTAWSGIATVIGPAGGGLLVDELSWRWIFWVNVPLIVATVLLALYAVRESRDPEATPVIDWTGILFSAVAFGGPTFALIEQPRYGWGDPLVAIPLIAGIVSLALFVVWEMRYRHPMMEVALFRIRNFSVTNGATVLVYGGLYGGFFFITIFLQQTAGYSALQAGLATTPISVMLFVLSPWFGKLASGTGPRLPMSLGPLVAGIGMLMLIRVDADAAYVTDVLPGVLVFALGLAATVAPLTATVLDSVDERHTGIASGINNGLSRVAGLLAIAAIGAVISAQFLGTVDDQLSGATLSADARSAVEEAKEKPLGAPPTGDLAPAQADQIAAAVTEANESSFHLGMGIAGGLMIIGGLVAAVGIQNPKRREIYPSRAATAGDCGHCPTEGEGRSHGAAEPAREPARA